MPWGAGRKLGSSDVSNHTHTCQMQSFDGTVSLAVNAGGVRPGPPGLPVLPW